MRKVARGFSTAGAGAAGVQGVYPAPPPTSAVMHSGATTGSATEEARPRPESVSI